MENNVDKIRNFLIENPEFILEDLEILNSLLNSMPKQSGKNIVDLRSVFSDRLEEKYNSLKKTHKSVVAAAHDNISTVKSINRAILKVLEADTLNDFLQVLNVEIKPIFKLSSIFLCLDSIEPLNNSWPDHYCLHLMKEGDCYRYFDIEPGTAPMKNVLLRSIEPKDGYINKDNIDILSEAVIAIPLSKTDELALLAMGSANPDYFNPNQATDLLSFFGAVIERHFNSILKNNE